MYMYLKLKCGHINTWFCVDVMRCVCLQRAVMAKRDELLEKLDDAKLLKEGIDRRSDHVAAALQRRLQPSEYGDYEHFIKMKSKLTVDHQDIEDKLRLGEEQLIALRKTLSTS